MSRSSGIQFNEELLDLLKRGKEISEDIFPYTRVPQRQITEDLMKLAHAAHKADLGKGNTSPSYQDAKNKLKDYVEKTLPRMLEESNKADEREEKVAQEAIDQKLQDLSKRAFDIFSQMKELKVTEVDKDETVFVDLLMQAQADKSMDCKPVEKFIRYLELRVRAEEAIGSLATMEKGEGSQMEIRQNRKSELSKLIENYHPGTLRALEDFVQSLNVVESTARSVKETSKPQKKGWFGGLFTSSSQPRPTIDPKPATTSSGKKHKSYLTSVDESWSSEANKSESPVYDSTKKSTQGRRRSSSGS